jgi:GNAT superfamily N-acetyltransferase
VEEWLQPDWIYEPHSGSFRWEGLRQRPPVQLSIFRANYEAWNTFSRHHYLTADLNKSAQVYVACIEGQPAALIAILPLVHGKVKNAKRISRIVVLPDFQGIGLATKFMDALCAALKAQGFDTYITTSHPALIRSLNVSSKWSVNRKPSRVAKVGPNSQRGLVSSGARVTAGFKFAGEPNNALLSVLAPKK